MKKTEPRTEKATIKELEPFDKRSVDVTKFKLDLSLKKRAELFAFPPGHGLDFLTIDTLGVTRTVGRGRTNLTFIRPTIVQADAAIPRASFDRTLSPSRNPTMSMHFEPSAYGITTPSSFLMTFSVECFSQSTFTLAGFAGSGTLTNGGTKVLNGTTSVTLGFNNVPPLQQTFGFLEQTAGAAWDFFSVNALVSRFRSCSYPKTRIQPIPAAPDAEWPERPRGRG